MPKILTARAVQAARAAQRRSERADGLVPGLYLVVQPSGAKSWALRYRRPDGRPAKYTIGSAAVLDLAAARAAAREALSLPRAAILLALSALHPFPALSASR